MSATRWSSPRLTEGWLRVECDHRDPSTHQQRPRRQGLPTAFRAPCSNAADRRVNCPARTPPGSRYHSSLTHLLEPPIQRQRPTGPDAVEQSRKSRPASPRRVPDVRSQSEATASTKPTPAVIGSTKAEVFEYQHDSGRLDSELVSIHIRFAFDETEALVETIGRLTRRPGREIDGDRTE